MTAELKVQALTCISALLVSAAVNGWMSAMLSVSHQLLCVQITIEAMKSDIDEVALQGIEFWSNVCDEEMDLAIEATEVMHDAGVTSAIC